MRYLIDDPSPFEPVSVWKEHLRDLGKLDQSAPEVRLAIKDAHETILWILRHQLYVRPGWPMREGSRDRR